MTNRSRPSVYDVAVVTPLEKAEKTSSLLGRQVYLKREDLQSVHSFKIRGAYNKIARLTPAGRRRGVIAASAGNHAQGVALSAQKLGLSALIVMPRTTPQIKIDAVKSFGGEVELAGDSYTEAFEYCQQRIVSTGRVFIHPFDDPLVIAGQGTVGTEIIDTLPDVTHIFVPIGGGGLIAGIAQAVKAVRPDIKIIGVEPEDSNAMQASLKTGNRVILPHVGIFADGVAVKQVGELAFALTKKYVDKVITVSTDQLCAAIKSMFEETRSIVEPAGALGLAGILHYPLPKDAVAVAICSGANMTFERLQFIAERTLLGSGQEALFAVTLPEQSGALKKFYENVIDGHNITEFNYRLHDRRQAHIFVGVKVSGSEDKSVFVSKLKKYKYVYTDLSLDDVAKEHIRHMIGGPSKEAIKETIYSINFPERPGALGDFLAALGGRWNISLFHYRGQGGDVGRVLIGFENASSSELEMICKKLNYDVVLHNNATLDLFI